MNAKSGRGRWLALRGEQAELRDLGVDLAGEPAIPGDDHEAVVVDMLDHPAIACTEARLVPGVVDQLDPHPDRHACADPRGELPCTVRVHG